MFFCYTTTDEYPVGSRKVDKLSVQIVTKKKIGIFGYDFADIIISKTICEAIQKRFVFISHSLVQNGM